MYLILLLAIPIMGFLGYKSEQRTTWAMVYRCKVMRMIDDILPYLAEIDTTEAKQKKEQLEKRLRFIQQHPTVESFWHCQKLMDKLIDSYALVTSEKEKSQEMAEMRQLLKQGKFWTFYKKLMNKPLPQGTTLSMA